MNTDLGSGFYYQTFTETGVAEPTGLIIYGPCAPACKYKKTLEKVEGPGICGGAVHFENSLSAARDSRPRWKVVSREPLTLTPSIKCGCDGQHGFITEGRYVSCA